MSGELYSTYDVVGIPEEVDDVISNIAPTDTPFLTAIGSEGIDTTYVEWQEDTLRAAAANYQIEGADATIVARSPTTMRANRTQIFADAFQISGTNERVRKYGRDSEVAYQTALAGKALKLDLERACVGVSQAAVTGDESTARRFAAAVNQIAAGVTNSNSGTPRALTEAIVLDVSQKAYTAGGDPKVLMIKPADALIVADFAKAAGATSLGRQRMLSGTDTKIVNVVDVYVTPFSGDGGLRVVLNRRLLSTEALALDPDMWKLLKLRPWFRTELAKTGDSQKWQIVGEFSLKHRNQSATGRATDLS